MRTIIIFAALCLVVVEISGYCHLKLEPPLSQHCTTADGTSLQVNSTHTDADKCEKCTCSRHSPGALTLHCCGYGIHAGTMMPPSGCTIITGSDGCSVKLVQENDITQLCIVG